MVQTTDDDRGGRMDLARATPSRWHPLARSWPLRMYRGIKGNRPHHGSFPRWYGRSKSPELINGGWSSAFVDSLFPTVALLPFRVSRGRGTLPI